MENQEIIKILKAGYVPLENSTEILGNVTMSKDDYCDCHNTISNAFDESLWIIAQGMGYVGNYDEWINEMIPRFPGTSNPPEGWILR